MGTLRERFAEKVGPPKDKGCTEWLAATNAGGYGLIRDGGKRATLLAHRAAWELDRGPIPRGLCVLHRCDNPPCVNPDHLFLGTRADNNTDMVSKGRLVNPPITEERKQKMRDLLRGRVDSPETRARKIAAQRAIVAAGGNRHMRGIRLSNEVKTQRSIRQGGCGKVKYAGVEYASAADAARAAGVWPKTMLGWARKFNADVPLLTDEARHDLRYRCRGGRPAWLST